MLEFQVETTHLDPFMALADAIIGEIDPLKIKHLVLPELPPEKLEEYCKLVPSKIQGFREEVVSKVNLTGFKSARLFVLVMSLLSSRITAPVLTRSVTLVTEMTTQQKTDLLKSWRDSNIPSLRQLFKSFTALTTNNFQNMAGELHQLAIGYPGRELRETLYEEQRIDSFKYKMIDRVSSDNSELYMPNIEALIIGSGAGAGVVAHTLQGAGYNCLVLEKGKYYPPDEYVFDDFEGLRNLYEGSGIVTSQTNEIFLLAGSTFGGGTTVNWSASIKTPFKVRKEWYDDYGVDFVANEEYDKCMDYVFKQMGASVEGIAHSHSNNAILNSTEALGYHSAEVNQNNGNHKNHDCGFCYLGCKYGIKQGSQACWLRDAAEKGCQFLDQVIVHEIIRKNGKAVAVRCEDLVTGNTFKIVGPKRFIVSGGSLHTPLVLQKSGFKNKNIGLNLKLHPVTVLTAFHSKDVDVEPYKKPIMTAVSNQVVDLDGKDHGPRIETLLHAPFIEAAFLPWDGSDSLRSDLLKYRNTSSMLIITRDSGSGKVYFDPRRPNKPLLDYSVSKYDSWALLQGFLCAADMLYMDGAIELLSAQSWTPRFISYKPKRDRKITDKDYVEWRKKVEKLGFTVYGNSFGSAHQMSSCRMSGKGPKYGAVDVKGRTYECKNVYVADASVLPTASGANPMVSTMAITRHIALDLVKELQATSKL